MKGIITGLDLGQSQDYSALVMIEQSAIANPDPEYPKEKVNRFDVRHIHRWELGTRYPKIIADLKEMFGQSSELQGSTIIVDATGVGSGVVDMVRNAHLNANMKAFTITHGFLPGEETVPKKDLVAAVLTALQTERLKFAGELELREILEKELEMFRMEVASDKNETFAAWRERDHDDLVLSLALAVWYGEKNGFSGEPYPRPTMTIHEEIEMLHENRMRELRQKRFRGPRAW